MGSITNETAIITTGSSVEVVSTGQIVKEESHTLAYIVVPLSALAVVVIIAFVVMLIVRKNRIDRLRHHLMPLYNFDPQEEDWESELLDDRGRKMYNKEGSTSSMSPQLQFNT
ncbi:small integral membrane protein 29-like [Ruditapes philippinarum]|uniref:small integral membrane protein 29-like n=1 Tax=Ruditapes philippinarum TaxID=129788 RepID=UPI00295B9EA0|nr:small integral membrane protein 29-like [Ruditapes philippinarum]